MRCSSINPILNIIPKKVNNTFKRNNKDEHIDVYKKRLEKRDYIDNDATVKALNELSTLAFIGAAVPMALKIDLTKKLNTSEKTSVGLIAVATGLVIAEIIKKCQLSKQYDKETSN